MGWNAKVDFKESRIHGRGVFAAEDITEGTKVWTIDDSMYVFNEADELLRLPKNLLRDILYAGYLHHTSDKFVSYGDGMQWVNHAFGDSANIGLKKRTPLAEDNCTALRDIQAGEELLEDYTFWSVYQNEPGHWLPQIYAEYCPSHFRFLLSLEKRVPVSTHGAA